MNWKYFFLLIVYTNYINVFSQKQDFVWITGYDHIDDSSNVLVNDFGNTNFDFNYDPAKIYFDCTNYNWLFETNTSVSDEEGNLLMYSNGIKVWNKNHESIIDTINYGEYWERRQFTGMYTPQSMITIPILSNEMEEQYSIFYTHYHIDPINPDYSLETKYTRISLNNQDSQIYIIEKDSVFFSQDTIGDSVTACRHANGRDWWVILCNIHCNKFYTYLIDNKGVHLEKVSNINLLNYRNGRSSLQVSPKGDKFIMNTWKGQFGKNNARQTMLDFDRCTGEISNPVVDYMDARGLSYGADFSLNGRYAYFSNDTFIVQYDLEASDIIGSKKIAAIDDGFRYQPSPLQNPTLTLPTYFGFLKTAPDGKIYIFDGGASNRFTSRMEYPDEEGMSSDVKQHSIFTRVIGRTIPNTPNYRLGPEDGSDCDTLSIDNHPIAKFRYEGDTTNHLNVRFTDLSYFRPETWYWDFGDGTTFDGRKPYWHEFPKNGTYNVCLTVSNENSENTMCRTVTIGSNSVSDTIRNQRQTDLISLFPNPTEGEVLLTISDYIPENGVVYFYDMMGREVYSGRIFYGWNNVDLSNLTAGNYIYVCKDNTSTGSVLVGEGKIVKL